MKLEIEKKDSRNFLSGRFPLQRCDVESLVKTEHFAFGERPCVHIFRTRLDNEYQRFSVEMLQNLSLFIVGLAKNRGGSILKSN